MATKKNGGKRRAKKQTLNGRQALRLLYTPDDRLSVVGVSTKRLLELWVEFVCGVDEEKSHEEIQAYVLKIAQAAGSQSKEKQEALMRKLHGRVNDGFYADAAPTLQKIEQGQLTVDELVNQIKESKKKEQRDKLSRALIFYYADRVGKKYPFKADRIDLEKREITDCGMMHAAMETLIWIAGSINTFEQDEFDPAAKAFLNAGLINDVKAESGKTFPAAHFVEYCRQEGAKRLAEIAPKFKRRQVPGRRRMGTGVLGHGNQTVQVPND